MKVPGLDDMQTIFYHKSWNIVSKSVCKMVKSFFTYWHMLKELNRRTLPLFLRSTTLKVFIIIGILVFVLRHTKLYTKSSLTGLTPKITSPLDSSRVKMSMTIFLWLMKSLNSLSKRQDKQRFMKANWIWRKLLTELNEIHLEMF